MVFSFIGSASLYVATVALAPPPNIVMAAFANGLTLGIVSASLNTTETPLVFAREHTLCRLPPAVQSRLAPHDSQMAHQAHARAVATSTSSRTRASDALPCAVYATANLSGGHITPTVTIATMITGHITILKGLAYVLAQLVGSVFGSLLIVRTPLEKSTAA